MRFSPGDGADKLRLCKTMKTTDRPLVEQSSEYMSLAELSAYASMSISTLRKWLRIGMPYFRLGRSIRIKRNDFDAWLEQFRAFGTEKDSPHKQLFREAVRHKHYDVPKTGKRLIDIADFFAAKLERHIRELRKAALREGKEVNFLFPGITARIVQNAIKRSCRHAAKVRLRSPHDLRHTYAALLLMGNVSPAYVQKQLGHHSITMTVDIYGHWIPGEGKGREHLNETFGGKDLTPSLKLKGSPFDKQGQK